MSANTNPADEAEIRALYAHVLDTWNRRSGDDMAALFTEDANLVGFDGSIINGQAEIAKTMNQIFADHQTAAYVGKVRDVRFLSADVALLRSVVGMIPPGQNDLNPAVNAVQSLVAVKSADTWRVTLYQNTPAQFHGRPELVQQLTDELHELLPK